MALLHQFHYRVQSNCSQKIRNDYKNCAKNGTFTTHFTFTPLPLVNCATFLSFVLLCQSYDFYPWPQIGLPPPPPNWHPRLATHYSRMPISVPLPWHFGLPGLEPPHLAPKLDFTPFWRNDAIEQQTRGVIFLCSSIFYFWSRGIRLSRFLPS